MIVILICFAIAAVIGVTMIVQVFMNKKPLKAVAISHGMFAATSLILLLLESLKGQETSIVSIILFIIAALAGLFMFYRDFFATNRELLSSSIPKPVAIIHAGAAVTAFILLLVTYLA